jgi:hypothetical protein
VPYAAPRRTSGSASPGPGDTRISHEVGATAAHCMSEEPQAIGLPAARSRDLFPCPTTLSRPTVPLPLRAGFIRSCRSSSSELLRRSFHPLLSERAVLPGLRPSSRRRPKVSTRRESFPGSRYVPPSGFLSLSTVYSTFGFTGLFHPVATSRVATPSRGFSRSAAVPTRRRAMPPCRFTTTRSPASRLPRMIASTSRPCSAERCVPRSGG